jgi:hypothetical protein
MPATCTTVDYSLLDRLTDLFVCSRCLRAGVETRVPQVVSKRHRPRTLCGDCAPAAGHRRSADIIRKRWRDL